LEREFVLRLKVQLLVPAALKKLPLSTETCTEFSGTVSEAVPATLIVPETVDPLTGAVIATVGFGVPMLMLNVPDEECPAASLT
jgi:hypothetical protein